MRRRAHAKANATAAVLLLAAAALTLPAAGMADSGGASLTPGDASAQGSSGAVQPAGGVDTVSSGGITVSAQTNALLRRSLHFGGTVAGAPAGTQIAVQRLDAASGWVTVATATTAADGSFTAAWRADHSGRLTLRAVPAATAARAARAGRSGAGVAAHSADDAPTLSVTVYPTSIATQYGEGFYGQQTACGERLTPSTLGVANRTLKCGTRVAILFHGRRIVVPVIDRGPYANHADWDLTEATGRALGMDGTATIGALPADRA